MAFGIILVFQGFASSGGMEDGLQTAITAMPLAAPITLGLAGGWFSIAFFAHQSIISASVKSRALKQSEEPRAYNMLESLCISRGMTIRDKNYQITLTRGLMNNLDDAELNAVIAHELSHIRHKDVRMLIIAVIFVGIFAFIGESVTRGLFRTNLGRTDHHRRSGGGNAGALIFFGLAIIAVTYFFAVLIRFTLSRKREYMADAGAVELTKDPDAMIRALEKISGKAVLHNVPEEIREMALHNPKVGLAGAFATHPPIDKRIEAIVKYGGGRVGTQSMPRSRMQQTLEASTAKSNKHGKIRRNPWQL